MKNPKNKAKALEELHQALKKAGKAGLFDEMEAFVDWMIWYQLMTNPMGMTTALWLQQMERLTGRPQI